jgi:hypothetical protein
MQTTRANRFFATHNAVSSLVYKKVAWYNGYEQRQPPKFNALYVFAYTAHGLHQKSRNTASQASRMLHNEASACFPCLGLSVRQPKCLSARLPHTPQVTQIVCPFFDIVWLRMCATQLVWHTRHH